MKRLLRERRKRRRLQRLHSAPLYAMRAETLNPNEYEGVLAEYEAAGWQLVSQGSLFGLGDIKMRCVFARGGLRPPMPMRELVR